MWSDYATDATGSGESFKQIMFRQITYYMAVVESNEIVAISILLAYSMKLMDSKIELFFKNIYLVYIP